MKIMMDQENTPSSPSNTAPSNQTGKKSNFDERTEEASAAQYFQFYGYLSQQQNMLQDYIRTSTYQKAILTNLSDFKDKVILDVGAGSGILSFFAIQAGAKKIYAVEASTMAQCCETLVQHNNLRDRIQVVAGKIEEITIPEPIDTIISEPMGYMLLNERMLETFLHAKKFLKPQGGKMFPSKGDLHITPFTDEALYLEQCGKANFWCQASFHGVNLSVLANQALKEYFRQPVVDTFHPGILLAQSVVWSIDFLQATESDLHKIEIPLQFTLQQTAYIHGLAFWFDVGFLGSDQHVWLSTAPTEPLTHWYQVRCLLETPLLGYRDGTITGKVTLLANKRQSYDVDLELMTSSGVTSRNSLDLKNPCFRYTGQPVQPPPGHHSASPSEAYWSQLVANQAMATENGPLSTAASGLPMVNGVLPAGCGDGPYVQGQVGPPHHSATAIPVANIGNVITILPSGQQIASPAPTALIPQAALRMVPNSTASALHQQHSSAVTLHQQAAAVTLHQQQQSAALHHQQQQVALHQQQHQQQQMPFEPPHPANVTDLYFAGMGAGPNGPNLILNPNSPIPVHVSGTSAGFPVSATAGFPAPVSVPLETPVVVSSSKQPQQQHTMMNY